jgi:DNA-binding transcriptional regulator LsrR (DeoR family)
MLLELIQQDYAGKTAHIGFSGGFGMRTLALRFGELLRTPTERLPEKIVFHAMVAGFDVTDPTTDPNAFFTYFVQDPAMQVTTSFVALHAPAMARPELLAELTSQPGIKEAYERAHEIDVIVTGASCWRDEHSALGHYLELAKQPVDDLVGAECIGDILWQPINCDGPIEMKTALRAMTLKQLDEVSEFVADQGHVLLVSGPCSKCHLPKTEIVKAILEQKRQLITHLAVDSRCGRDLLAM